MSFDPSTATPVEDAPAAKPSAAFDPSTATPVEAGDPVDAARKKAEDEGIIPRGPDRSHQPPEGVGPSGHTSMAPLVQMATQGGGAAAGAELGALGGPFAPVTIPLGAALGGLGGYLAGQKISGEAPTAGGAAQAALVSAIPGGSLAAKGAGAIVKQALLQGAGGWAGEALRSEIDTGEMPSAKNQAWASILPALGGAVAQHVQQTNPEIMAARATAEAQAATKQGIKDDFQAAGGVVNPAKVNPSAVNKALVGVSGSPAVNQAASHINGEVADHIARSVLDPANPAGVELSAQVANAVRQRAYDVGYRPVASAGTVPVDAQYIQDLQKIFANRQGAARSFPGAVNNDVEDLVRSVAVRQFDAGDALKMSQLLRKDAAKSFTQGDSELGLAQRAASKAIEDQIERHLNAMAAGTVQPPGSGLLPPSTGTAASQQQAAEMLQDFRDARKLMAQSHDIQDAVREGTNAINPRVLAAKYDADPQKLSGGVKTIGAFANVFPDVTKEASRTAIPGTTATGRMIPALAGVLTGTGLAAGGHTEAAGLATAAGLLVPHLRDMVRELVLSKPYQRLMTKIPVKVEADPSLGALVIRQGAQAAGAAGSGADAASP